MFRYFFVVYVVKDVAVKKEKKRKRERERERKKEKERKKINQWKKGTRE
jgi:hypothetical protein